MTAEEASGHVAGTTELITGEDGAGLVDTVKRLVHEGNVRRITVKDGDRTVVEFPLTLGIAGIAVAPIVAAVGAIGANMKQWTIEVERRPDAEAATDEAPA